MNKKGIFPLLAIPTWILIVSVVLLILGLIFFAFSLKFKLVIAGVFILLLTLVKILPKVFEKGFTKGSSIALILLILTGGFLTFGSDFIQNSVIGGRCFGGQVLSIDNINIVKSSNLGGKDAIRVVFSSIPTSECLNIRLNPDQLESELKESGINNFDAKNIVYGDIVLKKKEKVYNIIENQNNKFFKFDIKQTSSTFLTCTDNKCNSAFGSVPLSSVYYGGNCQCIYEKQTGVKGNFGASESFNWEAEIKIGLYSSTFSPSKLSGSIGSIAYAKWSGNLVSNDNLGSITKYELYKPFTTNQFIMTDINVQSNLISKFNTASSNVNQCDDGISSCNIQYEAVLSYNNIYDSLIQNRLNNFINEEIMVDTGTKILSNKLYVNLDSPIIYPTFTLDIDASEVGIFISEGEPDVSCPSNFQLNSGETKTASFTIKNVGDGSGSFSYVINCNKGSYSVQPSPPITLNVGESKILTGYFGLTTETSSDSASCSFTISELNTEKQDSCSFSFTSIKQVQCVSGSKTCEVGNTELWTCKSDGSYNKEKCQYGCSTITSEAKCNEITPPPPENTTKLDCKSYESEVVVGQVDKDWYNYIGIGEPTITQVKQCKTSGLAFTIVAGIFGILITIIILLFVMPKKGKIINRRKRK